MAKMTKKISLRNCMIDSARPYEIQEIGKDDVKFYNILDILSEFADCEGVSISISLDNELPYEEDGDNE